MDVNRLNHGLSLFIILLVAIFPITLNASENDGLLKKEVNELRNELESLKKTIANRNSTKTVVYQVEKDAKKLPLASENLLKPGIMLHPVNHNKDLNNNTTSTPLAPATKPKTTLSSAQIGTPLTWRWQDFLVQIHGSGTAGFNKTNGQDSSFDVVDFNPLFLVNYKDMFLLRAAVDFAVNNDGDTDTSLSFANINWFMNDYMIFGAGKFDSALGQFVQNISPDWINKLPSIPTGFDSDEAAPQSEIGVQLRGGFPLFCSMQTNYTLYVSNGPRALVDTTNGFIDHIGTDGYLAQTGNYVTGGRLGFLPIPQLEIGLSGASGNLSLYDLADNSTQLQKGRGYNAIGADIAYRWIDFNFRGEIIRQKVRAQACSIVPSPSNWQAWYLQMAYRIPQTKVEPVLRYGKYHTPFARKDQRQWTAGLNYWFSPSIVAKIAFELNHGQKGAISDANVLLLQLALGF